MNVEQRRLCNALMVAFLDRALEDAIYREIDAALDAQWRIWRKLITEAYGST